MTPATFIHQNTQLLPVPLVPEIKLHLAHEAIPLWQKTEEQLEQEGLPPPFWAFAWAGGQALARYILDNPAIVKNQRVLDLASGSGLVGIAAMQVGAASVLAADIDTYAVAAIGVNAAANGVKLSITQEDLLSKTSSDFDVILVGDLFYEKTLAARVYDFLKSSKAVAYIGDPGRSYLPKEKLTKVATYSVPVSRELEDAEIKSTSVWMLA